MYAATAGSHSIDWQAYESTPINRAGWEANAASPGSERAEGSAAHARSRRAAGVRRRAVGARAAPHPWKRQQRRGGCSIHVADLDRAGSALCALDTEGSHAERSVVPRPLRPEGKATRQDGHCSLQAKGALARDEPGRVAHGDHVLHVSRSWTDRPRALPVRVGWASHFTIRSQTRPVEAMIYR
jgi:hypothetical protein